MAQLRQLSNGRSAQRFSCAKLITHCGELGGKVGRGLVSEGEMGPLGIVMWVLLATASRAWSMVACEVNSVPSSETITSSFRRRKPLCHPRKPCNSGADHTFYESRSIRAALSSIASTSRRFCLHLPSIERGAADPVPATDLCRLRACLLLPQDRDALRVG